MYINAIADFNSISYLFFLNFLCAVIPLLLSFYLFRTTSKQNTIIWTSVFVVFIISLPGAVNMITYWGYFIAEFSDIENKYFVYYIMLPFYIVVTFFSYEMYTISLLLFSRYLRRRFSIKNKFLIEILISFICAIIIFIYCSQTFFDWNLFLMPGDTVKGIIYPLTFLQSICIVFELFAVITALYFIIKILNLIIWKKIEHRMMDGEGS